MRRVPVRIDCRNREGAGTERMNVSMLELDGYSTFPRDAARDMDVRSLSTVRTARKRDADMGIGARMPHAGECTVHPSQADSAAIALVVSAAIPATSRVAPPRHALCLLVPTTGRLCR